MLQPIQTYPREQNTEFTSPQKVAIFQRLSQIHRLKKEIRPGTRTEEDLRQAIADIQDPKAQLGLTTLLDSRNRPHPTDLMEDSRQSSKGSHWQPMSASSIEATIWLERRACQWPFPPKILRDPSVFHVFYLVFFNREQT